VRPASDVEPVGPAGRVARPPYVATATVLGLAVAVSHFVPAAHTDFPSSVSPAFLKWQPVIGPGIVVPIVLVVAAVIALPKALRAPTWAFLALAVLFVWVLSVTLAVQAGRAGTFHGCCEAGYGTALTRPLERRTDYLVNVPLVRKVGPQWFDQQYPYLARPVKGRLSLRAQTHPPGAVLLLWVLTGVTHDNLVGTALIVVLIGAAGAVPTYWLARELHGERIARLAVVLFAASPALLLYTATSMDAVFMTVIAAAAAALVRAPRSDAWAALAGALVVAALVMTYAALVLAVVGIGAATMAWRRQRWPRMIRRGVVAAAVAVLAVWAVHRYVGIDLVACFRISARIQREYAAYRDRPYWFWVFGSVVAFLLAAGVALTALLVRQTVDRWRARRPGFETVVWSVMVVSAVFGLVRGETEHIWQFMVPMVAAAAAPVAATRLRSVTAAGAGQALVTQVLYYTNW
jgi:hypothetical protein